MLFSVLQFGLVLATVSASCRYSVTCKCGSSGRTYARCVNETVMKHYSCDRWAYCQTCKVDSEFCVTCPPGRMGPTCRDEAKRTNREQFFSFGQCPRLRPPKFGSSHCSYNGRLRTCRALCLPGHHFEGDEYAKEITLSCDKNVWRPRQNFPDCKHNGKSCQLRISGSGSYNCTTRMDGTHCDINCGSKRQGRYHCNPNAYWKPTLPPCVIPKDGEYCALKINGGGGYNCTTTGGGTYCDITCDNRRAGRFHCYPGRNWNPQLPYCTTPKVQKVENTCLHPGAPRYGVALDINGRQITTQRIFTEGERVQFQCLARNATILGSRIISCKTDGTWTGQIPQCMVPQKVKTERISCPAPGAPKDGGRLDLKGAYITSQRSFSEGEAVLFFCNDQNVTPHGIAFIICRSDGTWSGATPICIKSQKEKQPAVLSCKHPGVVENGITEELDSETEEVPVGTQLTFVCREGYELEGANAIYCLRNNSWSENPPVCKSPSSTTRATWTTYSSPLASEVTCPHPGTIENGIIEDIGPHTKEILVGIALTIQCSPGTVIEGPKTIYCLRSGQWSDAPPACRINPELTAVTPASELSCKHPGMIRGGFIEGTVSESGRFPSGSELQYKCREGYAIKGRDTIYCLRDGNWSSVAPTCTLKATQQVRHFGVFLTTVMMANASLCPYAVTCPCGSSGKNFTRCVDVAVRSQYSCQKWANCKTCNPKLEFCVSCPPGRYGPTCTNESCTRIAKPRHGTLTCTDDGGNRSCILRCLPGYHFINSTANEMTVECIEGSWKPSRYLPRCENTPPSEVSCKHPGMLVHGIMEDFQAQTESGAFSVGTRLRLRCRDGYEMQGPTAIVCLRNGTWSEALPVCINTTSALASEQFCKHPGSVENGAIKDKLPETQQSFPLNSSLRFECNAGYEMDGSSVIHCILNENKRAHWSNVPPLCRLSSAKTTVQPELKVFCEPPAEVEGATTELYPPETKGYFAGTGVKFRCAEGYKLLGKPIIYCLRSGQWSEDLPVCINATATEEEVPTRKEIFCKHPGTIENGVYEGLMSSSGDFPMDSALRIQCRPGTEMYGPNTIYCLRTGEWSAAPPTCRKIPEPTDPPAPQIFCKHPGIIKNAEIEDDVSETVQFPAGRELNIKCREGYAMQGPDILTCLDTGEWTSAASSCIPPQIEADCGQFPQNFSGNSTPSRSDWPWTVGISTSSENSPDRMFCGGALLNKRTVVTAAHCVAGPQNLKLHFGTSRPNNPESGAPQSEQVRNISRIIIHPEYDDETHANDIALLLFEPDMYYGLTTQPICLPTLNSTAVDLPPEARIIVTGYGLSFGNSSSTADFKVKSLSLQPEETCDAVCQKQGLVSCSPSTFCAGVSEAASDCIHGGSPAVILSQKTNRHVLEGLVTRSESARHSWNGKCKRPESSTMLTNVTHFLPFILENLI